MIKARLSVEIGGLDRWNATERPYIQGGGLEGRYLLTQFHFHWASIHDDGSEHTMGGLHYPVELHLVHMKEGVSDPLNQPDGLAVVGVFINVGLDGTAFSNLDTAIRQVQAGGFTNVFDYSPSVNLPTSTENFYRYFGSLTTPTCNEAVIWTVLPEPISITGINGRVL